MCVIQIPIVVDSLKPGYIKLTKNSNDIWTSNDKRLPQTFCLLGVGNQYQKR